MVLHEGKCHPCCWDVARLSESYKTLAYEEVINFYSFRFFVPGRPLQDYVKGLNL